MIIEQDINMRLAELQSMRVGKPTAFELHTHRGGRGRVQRMEDRLFNQRVELQRQELLSQLAELEEEDEGRGGLLMMSQSTVQPTLFIPSLPRRKLVRRIGRAPRRW